MRMTKQREGAETDALSPMRPCLSFLVCLESFWVTRGLLLVCRGPVNRDQCFLVSEMGWCSVSSSGGGRLYDGSRGRIGADVEGGAYRHLLRRDTIDDIRRARVLVASQLLRQARPGV
jgi:hypothetical protein